MAGTNGTNGTNGGKPKPSPDVKAVRRKRGESRASSISKREPTQAELDARDARMIRTRGGLLVRQDAIGPDGKVIVGFEAKDPRFKGLAKWRPGHTGNPDGSSTRARSRSLVKQLLNDAINMPIPESWRGVLAELEADRPGLSIDIDNEDLTIAEVLTARIVSAALYGDEDALDRILSSEPTRVDLSVSPTLEAPALDETDERLLEVARVLGETGVLH